MKLSSRSLTPLSQTETFQSSISPVKSVVQLPHVQRFTLPVLLGLFCLCFLAGALRAASRNDLWMDEVLAVWVARLPSPSSVWSALLHGSEASPPMYDLLLYFIRHLGGDSYLLFRLPSILATLITGGCIFILLRRNLDITAAAYGMVFSLLGILTLHGTEARPYALVTACFAVAVLLWDRLDSQGGKLWRVCAICILLTFAISLHFYATLFVPCIAAMELLWSLVNRRVRIPVWPSLFVAGASTFIWLPFIRAQSRMIVDETASVDFYAKPTLGRLIHVYSDLVISDKRQILFLAATICVISAGLLVRRMRATNVGRDAFDYASRKVSSNLSVITVCALAFPLLVFIFSLVVTKTFNLRYCLIATIGFASLLAYVMDSVPVFRSAVGAVLLAACPLAFLSAPVLSASIPDQVHVVEQAPKGYPILVGEGRLYFELEEALPREVKSRLVYVDAPSGVVNPDPTNEHHLDRWRGIRPDLHVMSAKEFFVQNPHFYLFHTGTSTDVVTSWLRKQRLVSRLLAQQGDAMLFEAQAPKQETLTALR